VSLLTLEKERSRQFRVLSSYIDRGTLYLVTNIHTRYVSDILGTIYSIYTMVSGSPSLVYLVTVQAGAERDPVQEMLAKGLLKPLKGGSV